MAKPSNSNEKLSSLYSPLNPSLYTDSPTPQKLPRADSSASEASLPPFGNSVYQTPTFRAAYDAPKRVSFNTSGDSRTKQSFKDECDINLIMRRYQQTGAISHLASQPPRFIDVAEGLDFQQALNQVIAAEQAFGALPAAVRDRFGNDPGQLIEFVSDSKNREEARRLGLLRPEDLQATTLPAPSPASRHGDPEQSSAPSQTSSTSSTKN